MKATHRWLKALGFSTICFGITTNATALPGFMAGKKSADVTSHSTHVAVLKKGNVTAVTVMPDYEGPIEPFALVLAVPADVAADHVSSMKRDFVDHLDKISAPRFHEFWEQDPCDPGPVEQEWQRSMKANAESAFLGGGAPETGTKKVAKELFLDVTAKQKEGEYVFTVLAEKDSPVAWLKGKGYKPPQGADAAVQTYLDAGYRFVIAEVNSSRIELVGGERAQLSPIRYWTEQPFDTLPEKLGLLNSPGKQELVIYVLDPEQRYEAKNYKNKFPPTNITLDFSVKERMGEFYAALHDIILAKYPNTFLSEYAWSAEGCGEPCATEPLMIHELLSLGADVFERSLPEAERNPKPPEQTKEEKDAFKESLKELPPKERKQREKLAEEERVTVAQRQALVSRHKYVVSRMHYRYDAATLPNDPKIGSAGGHVQGGIWIPKGQKGEVPTEVKEASEDKLQTRYNNFHPWVPKIQCENPDRYRWGKAPRDYRGLRKIWVAEDLSRKNRKQIKPAAVVQTAIPDLGLGTASAATQTGIADAGVDGGADAAAGKDGKCGCRVPGGERTSSGLLLLAGLSAVLAGVRRRSRSRAR
jgi:hypothetical protein